MRKIFALFTVMVFSFLLVSCVDTEIGVPVISLSDQGVVSWEAIENADHYLVFIDTNSVQTTETSFDLTGENLASGTYTIYVVASVGESVSLPSNSVTYTVEDTVTTVDTPTNVAINGNVVSWTAVAGATSYVVTVDTTDHTVTTTSLDLATLNLAVGNHTVTVKALNGTVESTASTELSYTVEEPPLTLDMPANVMITDGIISWDAVTDAVGYYVTVDTEAYYVTDLMYDLTEVAYYVGDYSVTVYAVNGEVSSDPSSPMTYTVSQQSNETDVYAAVLLTVNPTYLPDLEETDFSEDWEYQNYVDVTDIASYYAAETAALGMTTNDAIGFFQDLFSMMTDGQVDSMASALSELSVFEDYDMTPQKVVDVLYGLADVVGTIDTRYSQADLAEYQAMLEDAQTELNNYLASTAFVTFNEDFSLFVGMTDDEMDAYDALLNASLEFDGYIQWNLYNALSNMVNEFVNYGSVGDVENYYWAVDYDETYLVDGLYLIAQNIYNSEGPDSYLVIESLNTVLNQLIPLNNMVDEYQWEVEDIQRRYDQVHQLMILLDENEEETKAALLVLVDFVFELKNNVPANIVTLLDDAMSGESTLTPTEIILIKDALINLLQDAVPTAEEFASIRTVELILGGSISGLDLSHLEDYVVFLGQLDKATLDLTLLFIEDFNALDFMEISAIIPQLTDEFGDFNPEDPQVVIDLLAFVQTYIEDFIAAHPTEIQALEDLVGSDNPEMIYQEILDIATAYMHSMLDPESHEYEAITYVIMVLGSSYEEVKSALAFLPTLGTDLIGALIDSEGSIIDVIEEVNNLDPEDDTALLAALTNVLYEANMYNQILTDHLTAEQINDLLALLRIPAVLSFYFNTDMALPLEDVDGIYTAVYPLLGELLGAGIDLEALFLNDLTAQNIIDLKVIIESGSDGFGHIEPTTMVDVLIYVDTLVNDFVLAHPTEAQAISDILGAPQTGMIYTTVLGYLIDYVEMMQVEEPEDMSYDYILYVLNEMSASYPQLVSALTLINTIGTDAIDHLVATEGSIVDLIIEGQTQSFTEAEMLAFINDMIGEINGYNQIVTEPLTEAQFTDLLTLAKIPFVIMSSQALDGDFTLTEVNAIVDTLYPSVATLLYNVVMLERNIGNTVDQMDATTYYGETGFTTDPELAIYLAFIDAADLVLTTTQKDTIDDSIDIVFNTLLDPAEVQTALELTPQDVIDMRADLDGMISNFYTDLTTYAALDFSQLTQTDIDNIYMFADMYGLSDLFPPSTEEMLMNADALVLNQSVEIFVGEDEEFYYFKYTASADGTYYFASYGDADPYMTYYDEVFQNIAYEDDTDGLNFSYTLSLLAGETAYFEVGNYDYGTNFTVIIYQN